MQTVAPHPPSPAGKRSGRGSLRTQRRPLSSRQLSSTPSLSLPDLPPSIPSLLLSPSVTKASRSSRLDDESSSRQASTVADRPADHLLSFNLSSVTTHPHVFNISLQTFKDMSPVRVDRPNEGEITVQATMRFVAPAERCVWHGVKGVAGWCADIPPAAHRDYPLVVRCLRSSLQHVGQAGDCESDE